MKISRSRHIEGGHAGGAADYLLKAASGRLHRCLRRTDTLSRDETWDEEQWDFLAARGCDEIQGFLLARPQPAQAIAELLPHRQVA